MASEAATRTILITGANRGIGRATASRLIARGHRVIVAARDPAAGARAAAALGPAASTLDVPLDLGSIASIEAYAARILDTGRALDVLLHNAGVMQQSPTRRLSADGFEETLAVNALGPLLLTARLLPALARSPSARVVSLSSRLHLPGSRGAPVDFDFDDPNLTRGYSPDRAYKNSKLAILWFTYELQRRLQPRPIVANAVCPGFVPETAADSTRGLQRWLLRHVLKHMPFATRLADAAEAVAYVAADPAIEGVGGAFFTERRVATSSEESRDPAKARRFWALACALLGLGEWPAPA